MGQGSDVIKEMTEREWKILTVILAACVCFLFWRIWLFENYLLSIQAYPPIK